MNTTIKGFSLFQHLQTKFGPYLPLLQWVSVALSPGTNRPAYLPNYSTSPSAEIKNEWSYTSIPLYVYSFIVHCLIKYRDNVTFAFYI
jgi:hypothetical protein